MADLSGELGELLVGARQLAGGATQASALVTGFHSAFMAAVIVAGLAIAVALTLIRGDELEESAERFDAEPVLELAA